MSALNESLGRGEGAGDGLATSGATANSCDDGGTADAGATEGKGETTGYEGGGGEGEVEVRESEALRVFEEEVMSQAQNGVEDCGDQRAETE